MQRVVTVCIHSSEFESLVHDSGRILVCAEYGYRRDLQYQQLKKKSAATALNTVLASAHIQMTK
jgi:hypothetical protein